MYKTDSKPSNRARIKLLFIVITQNKIFKLNNSKKKYNNKQAKTTPAGIEPATSGLEGHCSTY